MRTNKEVNMPNLSSSIEVDGKYYCWDKNTGQIYEIEAKYIPLSMESNMRYVIKKLIEKSEESSK
jgi:hypothetical protein